MTSPTTTNKRLVGQFMIILGLFTMITGILENKIIDKEMAKDYV